MEGASGGCVQQRNPSSWYPQDKICAMGKKTLKNGLDIHAENPIISNDPTKHDNLDTWPHIGDSSLPAMYRRCAILSTYL